MSGMHHWHKHTGDIGLSLIHILSGEVRAVSMIPVRVQEAKKLGFTTCIIPAVCVDSVKNIRDITLSLIHI